MNRAHIRAVLVDDSAAFRQRLESLLAETPGMIPVGSAASVSEAIRVIQETKPDLVFLDVFIDGGTALDVLRRLPGCCAMPEIAVMTSNPSDRLKLECFGLGARWFIDKMLLDQAVPVICQDFLSTNRSCRTCS